MVYLSGLNDWAMVSAFARTSGFNPISFAVVWLTSNTVPTLNFKPFSILPSSSLFGIFLSLLISSDVLHTQYKYHS